MQGISGDFPSLRRLQGELGHPTPEPDFKNTSKGFLHMSSVSRAHRPHVCVQAPLSKAAKVLTLPGLWLQVPPRFLVNSPVIWHALLKMKSVLSPREASRRGSSQLHPQTEGCATRSCFRQGAPLWLRGAGRLQGWNRPRSSRPWGQA